MKCSLSALLVLVAGALLAPPLIAAPSDCSLVKAWVYPAYGDDATGALNDPDQPYKSIQKAIDALHGHLAYLASGTVEPGQPVQGLVWCMPGLYGPTSVHGSAASGDTFPIYMRHGVHVRGVGARRCVIRGVPASDPAWSSNISPAFWPIPNTNCQFATVVPLGKQVLVSFAESSQYQPNTSIIPSQFYGWAGKGEIAEILDGFTFQGGDVQVVFRPRTQYTFPMAGRISNCVFDMRHMPAPASPVVEGASIGILMEKRFVDYGAQCGYFDQQVHIVSNTFVLSEYAGTWRNDARPGAVAIIDVTNSNSEYAAIYDKNVELRGLGNPGIQNNVIRTRPANHAPNSGWMAMLGIDATDCLVRDATQGGAFVPTNAFAPGRAGRQCNTLSVLSRDRA